MAINLDAIRKKVDQYNNVKGSFKSDSKVKRWKPGVGDHVIRVLPWKDAPEGTPFKERLIYYNIGKSWITSPLTRGDRDPIDDFIKALYREGGDENKALGKKLWPKPAICAAIVDRAAEDVGPQLWVMSKYEAATVLGFFLDDDYNDITDLEKGFDLKVSITASAKKYNGKTVYDTKIVPRPRPSAASSDAEKSAKWMNNLPNVDDYYTPKTTEEVQKQFDEWLNSGGPNTLLHGQEIAQANEGSEGTTKGKADNADELDSLVNELHTAPAVVEQVKEKDKKTKPKTQTKEIKSIDSALDDALGDLEDLDT